MNRDQATGLITSYFESWVEQNADQFRRTIHEDGVVRECTGAVIQGKHQLERWFTEWNESGNKVLYWNIHHIGYDPEKLSAFVEWSFKCCFEGIEYEWDGASVVYFRDALIVELNEYEMKREKFHPYQ